MVSEPESPQTEGPSAAPSQENRPQPHPLEELRDSVAELLDYLQYYISARIDSAKYAIRRRILVGSMIAVAVLAGAGVIVTSVVLVCEGICDGLSVLLGHRWAGELVTGFLFLAVAGGGAYIALSRMIGSSHRRIIAKYEAMQEQQRQRFGRDVAVDSEKAHG
jgi:hypothetical protein